MSDHDMTGLPDDVELSLTGSPLKGEKYGCSWDDGRDYGLAGDGPRFHAFGSSPEEALAEARRVYQEML